MAPLVSSRAGGARGLLGGRAASAAASKPSHSGEATTIRRRSSATRASREEWGRHLGARSKDGLEALKQYACALCGAAVLIAGGPLPGALAEVRLPPLDTDPQRCERAFVGNTLGMANAVADKLLDLRFCDYKAKDLAGKTLSGALMVGADFSGSNMTETVLTKAYAVDATFEGANFTNAVVDRVDFDRSNLKNASFHNAVVTGATFKDADLTGVDFEDALISYQDIKVICSNPTLTGDSRVQVGCKG